MGRVIDRRDRSETPKCAQCGSTTPEHGFTEKRIIHQDRDERGKRCVSTSIFTVCQSTPCGAHLQMAHEG